jgi:hypothetical protein
MAQHTKDFLAQELRAARLNEMADKAATGWYHDYLSPLAMPETQLLIDLQEELKRRIAASGGDSTKSMAALMCRAEAGGDTKVVAVLINRHMNGEFDASKEESDEWAASEDAAFRELAQGVIK